MDIRLPFRLGAGYKNLSQKARVITEAWAQANLYCASCPSDQLARTRPNTRVLDFLCPRCNSRFELKSLSEPLGSRIPDAAYDSMCQAIRDGRTPNLLSLHYDPERWIVQTLLLIPHFALSLSAIHKRNPLADTARRRGWVGCDIVVDKLPPDVRVSLVSSGVPASPKSVREQYRRLQPLARQHYDSRGWILDVLSVVRRLAKQEFTLAEVYAFASELGRLHPRNQHVEDKIRQQLQRLRDLGFLQFTERGRYRVRA